MAGDAGDALSTLRRHIDGRRRAWWFVRDERPLRLIRKAELPESDIERLVELAEEADRLAAAAGKELQFEFGKQHVGFIVGCNQFLRIYRSGEHAGVVEMWRPPAGLDWHDAVGGAVFRMFGWRSIHPVAGIDMHAALAGAFDAAAGASNTPMLSG